MPLKQTFRDKMSRDREFRDAMSWRHFHFMQTVILYAMHKYYFYDASY
jgi:hypothetical protein